jgi:CheY-like chemotaxis protein
MQMKTFEEPTEMSSRFGKYRYLIVDDEEFNLYLLKNILDKWGASYLEAKNGKEAADIAAKDDFDLILLDLRMPVLNGYEAARNILENKPLSKIIALTGAIKAEESAKIIQAGMMGYLEKPISESSLVEIVNKFFPNVSNSNTRDSDTEIPTLNLDDLKKITGGDTIFFNEMLRIFIRSSENGISAIYDNFKQANFVAVSDAAHKLAAPSKHINAIVLYNFLKKLEAQAENNGSVTEMERLISLIENEILSINAYLKQLLSQD